MKNRDIKYTTKIRQWNKTECVAGTTAKSWFIIGQYFGYNKVTCKYERVGL